MERNDLLTKKLTEIQMENEAIKYDKKQLEDQLDSMKSLCFNLESVISNTNKHIEHQKTNADNVVQNENDILVKSLFVEEAEVDKYIESSILEDI
jgi:hypothetical protein